MIRIATGLAAAMLALSVSQPAFTQEFRYDSPYVRDYRMPGGRHDEHRRHHSGRDAAIVGGLGIAAGLLIGGLVVDRPPPPPPPRWDRFPPPPRWDSGYDEPRFARPWTPSWYRWCSANHRFFDPRSGTFVGRDGRSHFCEVG
jgi:hypothetical protein